MLSAFRHHRVATMKRIGLIAAQAVVIFGAAACTTPGTSPETGAPKVEHSAPVTSTGRQAAVLNANMRTSYDDACKYGVTLTNNLPYTITNLSVRFAAYIRGDIRYQEITRNFFDVRPTNEQFREITFGQIPCDRIDHIEVFDPGHCTMGKLTRFSSQPGDCGKYVDIAPSPYVRMYKALHQGEG
jgi:hypothetical protein